MLTQKRDRTGHLHTNAEVSRKKTANSENTDSNSHSQRGSLSDSESPTHMNGVPVPRSRKIMTVVLTIIENYRNGTIVGAADGVDTPLSIQRLIDRCSFSELELKQLYRKAKKGGNMQKHSGRFKYLID